MRYLSWLAMIPLLVSPATANPPCISCAVPIAKPRVIVRVKKVVQPVPVFVPTYVATIAPYAIAAPLYPVPPPNPAPPVGIPAPLYPQQQSIQYGSVNAAQVQQQAVAVAAPGQPLCLQGNEIAELSKTLKDINLRLCVLEGRAPPLRAVGQQRLPSIFNKCFVCHSATTAVTKGKGFAMFDDKSKLLTSFSEKELRKIGAKVAVDSMPPPDNIEGVPPATPEEKQELNQWLAGQK